MLALALVWTGKPGLMRPNFAEWIDRRCATGFIATTTFGCQGCRTVFRRVPGRACRPSMRRRWRRRLIEGPTLSEHGVVRWRRVDLSRVIKARFGVHLAERSIGDMLYRLGFRRLSARPRHPGHDAAAQETHKKTSRTWLPLPSRSMPEASR